MIGRLSGLLIEKKPPVLLVDVNGVGYELLASMNTCYQLPEVGQSVVLWVHLIVREDAQVLYGFYEERERALFRILIKASGIGPKTALAILSNMDPQKLVFCIRQEDLASLIRIPGVGKKTAERLMVEMRDRLARFDVCDGSDAERGALHASSADVRLQDAISALVTLGYKPQEANRVVGKIAKEHQPSLSTEALIREALRTI